MFDDQGTRDFCRQLAASDIDIPDPDISRVFDEGQMPTMMTPPPFQKMRKRKPASELGAKIDRIASITFPMVCNLRSHPYNQSPINFRHLRCLIFFIGAIIFCEINFLFLLLMY